MEDWKYYKDEQCPNCGNDLEVLPTDPENEFEEKVKILTDGDLVRCIECEYKSHLEIDEDGVKLAMVFE